MAERRMFSKTIIDSDTFIDMPLSTQALYFHLSMRADDDGFINNPKRIQRMIGCGDDDLKLLVVKKFIIPFESGIVVIKHWKIHNYIQKDRYKPTLYLEEKNMIELEDNKGYTLKDTNCIQDVSNMDTQVRLGKTSIELGEDSTNNKSKDIFSYLEKNFARTISPTEIQLLQSWLDTFTEDIIKYAIDISCFNNIKTMKYVNGILNNWKSNGFKKLEECKEESSKQNQPKNTYNKPVRVEAVPDWMNKDIQSNKATKEEIKEMEDLLQEYRNP